MAEIISKTLDKAQQIVMGAQDDKLADMAKDTKAPTENDRFTSDAGVKQTNHDDWLKVVNDKHTGPALLEDPFGREKVISITCPFFALMCVTSRS